MSFVSGEALPAPMIADALQVLEDTSTGVHKDATRNSAGGTAPEYLVRSVPFAKGIPTGDWRRYAAATAEEDFDDRRKRGLLTAGKSFALFAGNSERTEPKNNDFPQELPRVFPREKGPEGSERAPSSAPRERFTAQNPCKSAINDPPRAVSVNEVALKTIK